MDQSKVIVEIKNYLELNDNENTVYQKIVECSKEKLNSNELSVQLRKLEKIEKPLPNKRRFYRAEINKIENKDSIKMIKATSWFF